MDTHLRFSIFTSYIPPLTTMWSLGKEAEGESLSEYPVLHASKYTLSSMELVEALFELSEREAEGWLGVGRSAWW